MPRRCGADQFGDAILVTDRVVVRDTQLATDRAGVDLLGARSVDRLSERGLVHVRREERARASRRVVRLRKRDEPAGCVVVHGDVDSYGMKQRVLPESRGLRRQVVAERAGIGVPVDGTPPLSRRLSETGSAETSVAEEPTAGVAEDDDPLDPMPLATQDE